MALSLDQIRSTAQRVAASHGLDVIEVEYRGAPKERTLRVFIEKNAEERAKLAEQAAAAPEGNEMNGLHGLNVDRLAGVTHDDCQAFSRDFGTVLDVEELVPNLQLNGPP